MFKSIISIILIAAAIAFFVFFTKPKWAELKVNRVDVEKLNTAQEKAKELKNRIKSLEDIRKNITATDSEKIKKMIPDNVENVKLIIDFDKMLQTLVEDNKTFPIYKANGVNDISQISTENPKISQSGNIVDSSIDASQLGVADFSFTVSLTYSDFIDFLKRIEMSTRIFDIESISFSAPSSVGMKNPEEIIYTFNIVLKTYWLKSK